MDTPILLGNGEDNNQIFRDSWRLPLIVESHERFTTIVSKHVHILVDILIEKLGHQSIFFKVSKKYQLSSRIIACPTRVISNVNYKTLMVYVQL